MWADWAPKVSARLCCPPPLPSVVATTLGLSPCLLLNVEQPLALKELHSTSNLLLLHGLSPENYQAIIGRSPGLLLNVRQPLDPGLNWQLLASTSMGTPQHTLHS